jgi:peroxiredoxin
MTRGVTLAVVMLAALSAAACGASGQQSDASGADSASESIGASAEQASAGSGGERAPNLSLTTLGGEEFSLAEKRGEVVALYFMAGWCSTCIAEAQAWSELYPEYENKGLEVLMVSADPNDTPQTIEAFRRAGGIEGLPWAIDRTGEFTRSLSVRALDSTIIIDREGQIVYRDAVPTAQQTLERELKEVL